MATRISPEPGPGPRDPDGGAPPDWLPPAAAAWIAERLEILAARRSALLVAAGAVVLLGLVGALLAPSLIPPRPLVGAAVGFAAVVLGVAAAIAVDSADLIVRGPRHVRAAGADLLGVLPEKPSPETAAELVGPLVAAGADRQAVGVAAASRHVTRTRVWADALGLALAEAGRRVVVADLTSRSEPGEAGVLEVVEDGRRLAEVVDIHPELSLARVGAGADHGAALQALAGVFPRLPRDIEVLLVALPPVASPAVLGAAASLDQVVVLAQTDITSRVDLIATLDAVDAIGAGTEVLLLDSRLHLAANGAGQPPPADAPPGTDGDAPAIDADGAAPDESIAEASTDQASTVQASTDQASADEDTAAATDTAADAATDRDVDAPQDQDAEASQRQDTDAATDEDTDAATEEDAPAPTTDAAPDATATGEATGAAGTDQDVADVAAEAEADEGTSPAPPLESGAGDADEETSASAAIEPDPDVGGATVVAPTPVQPVLLTDDDWAARVISREPLLPHAPDTAAPASDPPEPAPDTAEPASDTPEPAPDTAEPAPDTPEPAPDTAEPAPDTAQAEGATEVGPADDIEDTDEIPRVRVVPGPPAAPHAPADPAAPASHAPAHQGAPHPPDRAAPPAPPESARAAPASPAPNGASPSGEPPGTPPTDAVALDDLDDLDDLDERDEQGEGGEIRSLAAIDALNRQLEDRQLESHDHGHDHDRGRDREHDRELGR